MTSRTNTIRTFALFVEFDDPQHDVEILDAIISKLRPSWNRQSIRAEPVHGGLINSITCFYLAEDKEKRDAIAVRTFNNDQDTKHFNRHFEFLVMQIAEAAGVFPAIMGVFENGIAYQYVHGSSLRGKDLHDPKIIRYHAECPPPSEWMKELDYMETFLSDLNLPQGVAHHDLHIKNIIYNDETDQAYFVDYEFSSLGFNAFDFFSFYGDCIYRELMTEGVFHDADEPLVTEDFVMLWQREYLRHRYLLEGRDPDKVTDYDLEKLRLECQIIEVLNHLHWTLVAYSILEVQHPGFDVFGMINLGGKTYRELKPKLGRLKEQYIELLLSTDEAAVCIPSERQAAAGRSLW